MRALAAAPPKLYDLYVWGGGSRWLLVAEGLTLGEAYELGETYRNNGKVPDYREQVRP